MRDDVPSASRRAEDVGAVLPHRGPSLGVAIVGDPPIVTVSQDGYRFASRLNAEVGVVVVAKCLVPRMGRNLLAQEVSVVGVHDSTIGHFVPGVKRFFGFAGRSGREVGAPSTV